MKHVHVQGSASGKAQHTRPGHCEADDQKSEGEKGHVGEAQYISGPAAFGPWDCSPQVVIREGCWQLLRDEQCKPEGQYGSCHSTRPPRNKQPFEPLSLCSAVRGRHARAAQDEAEHEEGEVEES
eukprot:CAMPEP_0117463736 /NCGR_PEP_ID=MMETSP0784-20121206/3736_1 /TAXON_ID=39447 /ORGANISM="" /LENGTH=124 /DNA_ID=CAMNT_0005257567 /DNA_START=107 /DNA_END=481 /DNA_ORIENTATION=-